MDDVTKKEDRVLLARLLPAAFILLLLAAPAPARADPDLISLGAGGTDVLNKETRAAADFRLEYRFGVSLLPFLEEYIKIKPLIAGEVTSRKSAFGGAGIWLDIPIGTHFALTPQFVAGGYEQGNGKYLGSAVEFRSTFEAAYIFDNQSRVSFAFGHMSNAGITKHNPGTESAVISYQIPFGALFGTR